MLPTDRTLVATVIRLGIVVDLELDGEHSVSLYGLTICGGRLEAPLFNGSDNVLLQLRVDESQDDNLARLTEFIDDQTNANGVTFMLASEDRSDHVSRLRSGPVFVFRLSASRIRNGESGRREKSGTEDDVGDDFDGLIHGRIPTSGFDFYVRDFGEQRRSRFRFFTRIRRAKPGNKLYYIHIHLPRNTTRNSSA